MPLPHMYRERTEEFYRTNRANPTVAVYATAGSLLLGLVLATVMFFITQ